MLVAAGGSDAELECVECGVCELRLGGRGMQGAGGHTTLAGSSVGCLMCRIGATIQQTTVHGSVGWKWIGGGQRILFLYVCLYK